MALVAYRHILRAARIAFQGDVPVLNAAQSQIRQHFEEKRTLESSPIIRDLIQHAEDVATVLRQNIVQGRKVVGEEDTYKLRIHKDTERGDNESILTGGAGGGGCGCK